MDRRIDIEPDAWATRTTHGFRIVLEVATNAPVHIEALHAGGRAAEHVLSVCDEAWMVRLQSLATRKKGKLEGWDYVDYTLVEFALRRALEAAFPRTGGKPPPPLTPDSFLLRITPQG